MYNNVLSKKQILKLRNELLSGDESRKLAMFFGTLSDVGRLHILKLLLKHSGLCVTDIAHILDVSIPAASQQLKVMELNGLVEKERHGQMTCFFVRKDDLLVKQVRRMIDE